MSDDVQKKYQRLRENIQNAGALAVAFSGGVDSSFLLWVAGDVLGERALAVTVRGAAFSQGEMTGAEAFCRRYGIRQVMLDVDVFKIPGFENNPPDRCYICKKTIFSKIIEAAREQHFDIVAEGSNVDDLGDYRPGLRAIAELGIRSPLREVGLTKTEIRQLSHEHALDTWNKPSADCLASRFVYGERITPQKLGMVDQAEAFVRGCGIHQTRVRIHGELARIEVPPEEIPIILEHRGKITYYLKSIGFLYVTLDLQGYRMGSMNETLGENVAPRIPQG